MEKIVVTGYGIIAPGVSNASEFKEVLEKGLCTQERVAGLGPNGEDLVCGVVHSDFKRIGGSNYKSYPRVARLALAAAEEAIQMSRAIRREGERISVIMGTSVGGLAEIEQYAVFSNSGQFAKFPLSGAGAGNPHSLSSAVASRIGGSGMVMTLSTGCTAGLDAVLMAKLLLETNQTDVCVIGGSDAPLTTGCIYSFSKMGALATELDVGKAGAPFSNDSEGFVLAEGAAVLVLEREGDALRREADIYGTVDRVVTNNDGESIFAADTTGKVMTKTLRSAVGDVVPDYLNSQALGLKTNDTVDYIAYKDIFGDKVPVTTIKSLVGHAFGASGTMQMIAALLSMEHHFIPPTLKSTGRGFSDLPIVTETIYRPINRVAITCHGYGGNNTCMLLSGYKDR